MLWNESVKSLKLNEKVYYLEKQEKRRRRRPTDRDYVNNKQLYLNIIEYQKRCDAAEAKGVDIPSVPMVIYEDFQKLAENISIRPNFRNYSYKDDMISEGIAHCLKGIRTFNPDKYDNPYGYFSQAIWNAFLLVIKVEKQETYVKYKLAVETTLSGDAVVHGAGDYHFDATKMLGVDDEYMQNFVKEYEAKLEEKRLKRMKPKDDIA